MPPGSQLTYSAGARRGQNSWATLHGMALFMAKAAAAMGKKVGVTVLSLCFLPMAVYAHVAVCSLQCPHAHMQQFNHALRLASPQFSCMDLPYEFGAARSFMSLHLVVPDKFVVGEC